MSSIDQILERAATAQTDLETLIQSTKDISELMEPWTTAEAHHPEVEGHLTDVQFGISEYSSSVDVSLETVHLAHSYAIAGEELCGHLKNNDNKMIDDCIGRMKELAEQCDDKASKAAKMFRNNKRKLNKIRAAIPITSDRLLVAQKRHEEEKVFVPTVTPFNVVKAKWYSMEVVLPASWLDAAKLFVVPIVQTISASRENTCKAHERMYHTCVKAGKQLDETITVLEKVAAHTEKLAAYCLDIGERLADLQDLVEDLRSESINRSKMVALKHKWTAVKDAHSEYKAALSPPKEAEEIQEVAEETQDCPPYPTEPADTIETDSKISQGPQRADSVVSSPPQGHVPLPSIRESSPVRQHVMLHMRV